MLVELLKLVSAQEHIPWKSAPQHTKVCGVSIWKACLQIYFEGKQLNSLTVNYSL